MVATEVRKLAEVSRHAASEINEATLATSKSAQIARSLLSEIVSRIQETAELVRQITLASVEEETRLEEMRLAMDNLDQTEAQAQEALVEEGIEIQSTPEPPAKKKAARLPRTGYCGCKAPIRATSVFWRRFF